MELPGITSISCPTGIIADEKELEYISALHQSCLPDVRVNGTISSKDIATFLCSRYGIVIKPEVAKEIARNLCGARVRESKAKSKAFKSLLFNFESLREDDKESEEFKTDSGVETDEGSDSDAEVYFDLVKVMALLLIPEMIDLSKKEEGEKGGVFDKVLDQLLEPLNDNEVEILKETGDIDETLLRRLLLGAGDFDTAADDELVANMLSMIREEGSFDAKTFAHCVTSDVSDGYTQMQTTSTFFDVFGFNWERANNDQSEKFEKKPTLPFIDYATHSYNYSLYNASIWCLCILTILFYWISVGAVSLQEWIDGDSPCGSFWCIAGGKIITFSITGLIVGVSGVMIILLTSVGNVAGQYHRSTLVSVVATILFGLAPFIAFTINQTNIAHDSTDTVVYENLCPPTLNDTKLNIEGLLKIDIRCHRAKEWCREHPEMQGQNIIVDPLKLSYQEMNRCVNNARSTGAYSFAHFCVDDNCTIPNTSQNRPTCVLDNNQFYNFSTAFQCFVGDYDGECGLLVDTNSSESVCCLSGRTMDTISGPVCTNQPISSPCTSNRICDSKNCVNGFCDFNNQKKARGSNCTDNGICVSNYCSLDGLCDIEPTMCPTFLGDPNTELLVGVQLFPFCVSESEFCLFNRPSFNSNFNCTAAIKQLEKIGVLNVQPEEESNSIKETEEHLNPLEKAFRRNFSLWTFYTIGAATVASLIFQLRLYFFGHDERPRSFALKVAAKAKLNGLIENAMNMRMQLFDERVEGEVMRNYFLSKTHYKKVGGFMWTFSGLKSFEIMNTEGISIPSRLVIANIMQMIALTLGIFAVIFLTRNSSQQLDEYRRQLSTEHLKNLSTKQWYLGDFDKYENGHQFDDLVKKLPEGWMIISAAIPAIILSSIVGVLSIIVYIPSFVSSTLMFRSGVKGSLHDPTFSELRQNSDLVNQNIGNIVFSLLGGCIVTLLISFLLPFVFIWDLTRPLFLKILAFGLGIGISVILSTILQAICRAKFYVAFHRTNVLGANVSSVFFECWNFANAVLTIIRRICIVVAMSFTGLGRIDIPFLHPEIGSDIVAANFKREILSQDAHLHPYLDRLSGMYLRRLRDGEMFGSVEGQAWRCLFVIGLCPWLVKYRVNCPESFEKMVTLSTRLNLSKDEEEAIKIIVETSNQGDEDDIGLDILGHTDLMNVKDPS
eukprot:CAMPEP_0197826714 /NCGR_PEP_ID=MMETSP1437-20131217/3623_1 /TAXON_ID=49252 ORGANISM="Eucampia antarctica, Strain CCMP1452" /NCGR_SAMPLE_ID=MMETSP1437 /ASSEMBLY_ACC=CAM_ASM_001096 /LENGTH=1174 /DNA_ID=CAMNT_0043427267 /DNA_START=95 /DNA_END=3619 /DNA_ORIENTATION=-